MFRRFCWTFLGVCAFWAPPALSQAPTAEQIELLRTMTPEDRSALLEQLGIDAGSLDESVPELERRRARGERDPLSTDRERKEQLLRDKSLKPDDTVLIELNFKKGRPARVEQAIPGGPPVTIPAEPPPELTDAERTRLSALIDLVQGRNPFQLDPAGQLHLPGFEPVMLAGLNEEQATRRLGAIPEFRKLDLTVLRLPVKKVGVAGLRQFGYDLFQDAPSTFAPLTDVPVPSDYIVGPGDQISVHLYGSQNRNLRLTVSREGRINLPELGPLNVAGRTFASVAADIEQRISQQMIGIRASVSMGDTRSIQVLVMGEAQRPGSYTVSGLATITSVLYASGGIRPIGSMRDVQLKRQGQIIRRLDLYDLLLRGDTSDDAKLLPGDVVFIPPIGQTVAVDGEVNRPAIYEIKGNTSVADIIQLAGGLTPQADASRAAVVRVNEQRARIVVDVSLEGDDPRAQLVRNGDSLRVLRLRPTLDRGVLLGGHLFRSGPVAWHEGIKLTDVIGSIEELRPNADPNYLLIRREGAVDRHVSFLSADLAAALRNPNSLENVVLEPRDRIVVFDRESGRQHLIAPLLDEVRRQASLGDPGKVVRISGRVAAPGEYPLESEMRVSDLMRAGGGLQDAAYGTKAELTRYRLTEDGRITQHVEIDLAAILRGDASADLLLQPFDYLNVKEVPEWSEQEQVTLLGEVRFPGTYPIQRGETLRSVLERAGGLTSLAFPEGAVFTRMELLQREQEQIDRLADRLQNDLAVTALSAAAANQAGGSQALAVGQSLLNQLKSAEAVGRLVIDVNSVIRSPVGGPSDIAMREGDRLLIPKIKQEVTVIGEVQNVASHFYRPNLTRDDYLAMSGGVTRKADRGRIYVVRANGSVVSGEGAGWFRRSAQVAMQPGDTVVVPLDTERMPALPLWNAVTQILYNLAIAAAAVNSF
jgi:polysaccharide export outer membrane protein